MGALGYGVDVSTFVDGDLSPNFTLVSGERAIAESVLRLWLTKRTTLITDEDAGHQLLEHLSQAIADGDSSLESTLRLEALRDERVSSIDVAVEVDRAAETLTVTGVIHPADEADPFEFVFQITASRIDILLPRLA